MLNLKKTNKIKQKKGQNYTMMCKNIKLFIIAIGGFCSYALGGYDMLIQALITLVIVDYITGILKAVYQKKISSEIGYMGIIKKAMMFLVVSMVVKIETIVGNTLPLRDVVVTFFIANEGISIFENASEVIPMPTFLEKILKDLKNETISKVDVEKEDKQDE